MSSTYPFINPSYPSIHPTHPFILSIHSFSHPFILPIHSSYPSIHPFILPIHSFSHPFIIQLWLVHWNTFLNNCWFSRTMYIHSWHDLCGWILNSCFNSVCTCTCIINNYVHVHEYDQYSTLSKVIFKIKRHMYWSNNLLHCQTSDNTITIYQKFIAIGTFISEWTS